MERVSELLRCRGAKTGFEDEVGVSGGQSQKGIQGKAMASAKTLRHSRAGVCGAPTCSGVSLPRSRMGGNSNSSGGWRVSPGPGHEWFPALRKECGLFPITAAKPPSYRQVTDVIRNGRVLRRGDGR